MSAFQYRMHLRYPCRRVRIARNRQLVSFPETHVGTGTYKRRYNSASKTICSTCRQSAVTSINKRDIRTLIMYKSCFKGTIKSCVLGAFLCVSKLLEPHTHSKIVGMKITACVMFAAHFHSPYPLYFILISLSVSSFYTSFVFRHFYIFLPHRMTKAGFRAKKNTWGFQIFAPRCLNSSAWVSTFFLAS